MGLRRGTDGVEISGPVNQSRLYNPEELRRFAARLKQFNNEMISQLTTLHGQLAGLSQTSARPRA